MPKEKSTPRVVIPQKTSFPLRLFSCCYDLGTGKRKQNREHCPTSRSEERKLPHFLLGCSHPLLLIQGDAPAEPSWRLCGGPVASSKGHRGQRSGKQSMDSWELSLAPLPCSPSCPGPPEGACPSSGTLGGSRRKVTTITSLCANHRTSVLERLWLCSGTPACGSCILVPVTQLWHPTSRAAVSWADSIFWQRSGAHVMRPQQRTTSHRLGSTPFLPACPLPAGTLCYGTRFIFARRPQSQTLGQRDCSRERV